jgi:hypothetical protein
MASPDGPPPPVSNPITGTWRNSFADKDQKGRALQKFDRVEELVCDHLEEVDWSPIYSLRDVKQVCAAFYEKLAI